MAASMIIDENEFIERRRTTIGVESLTGWTTLDQRSVDVFSSLTGDYASQHNDPEWARSKGRFGGRTIAHGLFGAALFPYFLRDVPESVADIPSDRLNLLNYGIENLRFVSPIFVGVPLRARVTLTDIVKKAPGRYVFDYAIALEQENAPRPCLVAHSLAMVLFDGTGLGQQ